MDNWQSISQHIESCIEQRFSVEQIKVVGGGSINRAYLVSGNRQQYFVKLNQSGKQSMFEAEAKGLVELAAEQVIRVPDVLCYGDNGQNSYIVLEYLELGSDFHQVQLGEQLADLHQQTGASFGWQIDNTIGITHQPNQWQADWVVFWQTQRLGFQLKLAQQNGYHGEIQKLGERLLVKMPALFEGRNIKPVKLHGDLWGGNVAGLPDGRPVLFDPAFYYGDREADLAMTGLFGGFSAEFYAAYRSVLPLDEGFRVRKTFYNLYHVLNHMNMFGGGYQRQALTMMETVLAEL